MEKNRSVMVPYGVIGVFLSIFGGFCIHFCVGADSSVTSVFKIPVFVWGILGYGLLILVHEWSYIIQKEVMIITSIPFVVAFVYGTSAAIGISVGAAIFCPFCLLAWILNGLIVTGLVCKIMLICRNISTEAEREEREERGIA